MVALVLLMVFVVPPGSTTGLGLAGTYRLTQLPRELAQVGTAMLPCAATPVLSAKFPVTGHSRWGQNDLK